MLATTLGRPVDRQRAATAPAPARTVGLAFASLQRAEAYYGLTLARVREAALAEAGLGPRLPDRQYVAQIPGVASSTRCSSGSRK
jgi:hypothetical protein